MLLYLYLCDAGITHFTYVPIHMDCEVRTNKISRCEGCWRVFFLKYGARQEIMRAEDEDGEKSGLFCVLYLEFEFLRA